MDSLPAAPPATKSHRVLVVDDDLFILQLVQDKLKLAGYAVLTAASGQQALALIVHRGFPHLAIVDVVMPGIDGFELCRTMQQYADLPVIMLAAIRDFTALHELRTVDQSQPMPARASLPLRQAARKTSYSLSSPK